MIRRSPASRCAGEPAENSAKPGPANWTALAERANYRPRQMAELCSLSLRHLERRFKMEVGFTPRRWLKQERLRHAQDLLQGVLMIKQIAYGLGYRQLSQFCREFKLGFGITPSEFRRLHRRKAD